MDPQSKISELFKAIAIVTGGTLVLLSVLSHWTGAISGAVIYVGGTLCVVCLLNPASGMLILGFFCFYLDFVKKLAVVYGLASTNTVIEVLAVQILALVCTVTGVLLRLMVTGKLRREHLVALAVTSVLSAGVFALFLKHGFMAAGQEAANIGAYAGLIIVLQSHAPHRERMLRYLDYLFWLAVPWAAYGTVQYFYGFADFEWAYAKTWLSPVSANQMFAFDTPRPFGFASGEGGYGVLGQMTTYGLWRLWERKGGVWWLCGCVIMLAGLVASLQRTILFFPLLCAVSCWAFRRQLTTWAFYGTGLALFVAGVAFSETLLTEVRHFDGVVELHGGWSGRVIKLGSWSDRLIGWNRLKRASTYTLLGRRWSNNFTASETALQDDGDFSHDTINAILDNVGLAGLLSITGLVTVFLVRTHRKIWQLKSDGDRRTAIFLLAILNVVVGFAMIGGSNLGTTPHNLVNWTFLACLVTLLCQRHSEAETLSEPAEMLHNAAVFSAVATSGSVPRGFNTKPKFGPFRRTGSN